MTGPACSKALAGHGHDILFGQQALGKGPTGEPGLAHVHHDEHATFGHAGRDRLRCPQAFDEDPIAAFKRNIYVNPFHEDNLQGLIDAMGADHILFGSDYPHPEGLAEPCSYIDHLPADLPPEDVAKIMGGNLAQIMRVEAAVAA